MRSHAPDRTVRPLHARRPRRSSGRDLVRHVHRDFVRIWKNVQGPQCLRAAWGTGRGGYPWRHPCQRPRRELLLVAAGATGARAVWEGHRALVQGDGDVGVNAWQKSPNRSLEVGALDCAPVCEPRGLPTAPSPAPGPQETLGSPQDTRGVRPAPGAPVVPAGGRGRGAASAQMRSLTHTPHPVPSPRGQERVTRTPKPSEPSAPCTAVTRPKAGPARAGAHAWGSHRLSQLTGHHGFVLSRGLRCHAFSHHPRHRRSRCALGLGSCWSPGLVLRVAIITTRPRRIPRHVGPHGKAGRPLGRPPPCRDTSCAWPIPRPPRALRNVTPGHRSALGALSFLAGRELLASAALLGTADPFPRPGRGGGGGAGPVLVTSEPLCWSLSAPQVPPTPSSLGGSGRSPGQVTLGTLLPARVLNASSRAGQAQPLAVGV